MNKFFNVVGKIVDVLFVVVSFALTFWMYPVFLVHAYMWKWVFESDENNHVDSSTFLKPSLKTSGRFFTMIWAMAILTFAYKAFIELLINAFS